MLRARNASSTSNRISSGIAEREDILAVANNYDLLTTQVDSQDFKKHQYVFYDKAALLLLMADHETIGNPNDGCCFRDPVRCRGMNAMGYFVTTINRNDNSDVAPGIHCNSSINNLRRLIKDMNTVYSPDNPPNDCIIKDFVRVPDNWMRENITSAFFSEVIPYFLANDKILKPGGEIILPNIPYVAEQLSNAFKFILPLAQWVRVAQNPKRNPLFVATELMEDELSRSSSNVCNASALPVLLNYTEDPFIIIKKRGGEDGDCIVDLSDIEDTKSFVPYSMSNGKSKHKRPQTPARPSSLKRRSLTSPIIDLTSDEEESKTTSTQSTSSSVTSASLFRGRVNFSP